MSYYFSLFFFFFNDTATTEIYTLSLHDALPIWGAGLGGEGNEVADFVDEGAERVAGGVLRLLAQLLHALECTVAAIQQRADVHDRGVDRAPRVERGRAGCRARVL